VNHIYTDLRLSLEFLWRLASSLQFLCKTFREEEDSVSLFPDSGFKKIEMISGGIASKGPTVPGSSCIFPSSMKKATGTDASERVRDAWSRRWNASSQTRYRPLRRRRVPNKCDSLKRPTASHYKHSETTHWSSNRPEYPPVTSVVREKSDRQRSRSLSEIS
jgi:hypothetical protein